MIGKDDTKTIAATPDDGTRRRNSRRHGERMDDKKPREVVEIDESQFGFMTERSTTDAIFMLMQLMEK